MKNLRVCWVRSEDLKSANLLHGLILSSDISNQKFDFYDLTIIDKYDLWIFSKMFTLKKFTIINKASYENKVRR